MLFSRRGIGIVLPAIVVMVGICSIDARGEVALSLVPMPREVVVSGNGRLAVDASAIERAVGSYVKDGQIKREGYRLSVDERGMVIRAADDAGAFYAGQTLRQLAEGDGKIPYVTITDAPAFSWRGVMLDDSRHFFGKEAVLRLLEKMAEFKFNVLHWHLTDNEGWRIPIEGYPQLTNTVRKAKNTRHFRDLRTEGTIGPEAYTKEDIREVLKRAAQLHIRVMPEVEIPGHSRALLEACPEFACSVETHKVNSAVCVGKDATIKFFERVLDEVCALFPGEVVHIGGDECPRDDWERCSDCRARMLREGIRDMAGLQAWTTAHFARYLAGKGRRLMGWDEIVEGGLPSSAMVMCWRGTEDGIGAVKGGHEVVMAPCEYCYLDYEQCVKGDSVEYAVDWTVPVPWQKVYRFDPLKGVPEECKRFVLGAQANNWTEMTCTEQELQWKMWPRAVAMAEVLWTYPLNRDMKEFAARLERRREALIASGVNAAPVRKGSAERGRLETIGDGAARRFEYQCGKTLVEMMIKDGELIVKVNGSKVRDFVKRGRFSRMEAEEMGEGEYMVTAYREKNPVMAVVWLEGENIRAIDRYDNK